MIQKNCCGGSALGAFGALDVDDLYRAVIGASDAMQVFFAISQFLCGAGWVNNKAGALALLDSHLSDFNPDIPDNFPATWVWILAARQNVNATLHPQAECQDTVAGWMQTGKNVITQLIDLGKQKTGGAPPPKTNPPATTANMGMILGLGAAALAAVLLLGGKKS